MDNLIESLIETGEKLIKVEHLCHEQDPMFVGKIVLYFQYSICVLVANEQDDSLEIQDNLSESFPEELASINYSHKKPWVQAIGGEIRWVWLMTNQQGYIDGMQFEFINAVIGEDPVIIQLMVAASSIEVRTVICEWLQ